MTLPGHTYNPDPVTAERRKTLLALAILAAIPTLLFLDVLIGANVFYARDVTHYYYPANKVVREIVLGGEFPYWNRWFSAGQPAAANPDHAIFYPLTWLILLPSFDLGFRLLALVHVYIATFGMYALLRSMRLERTSAVFGAISFGIGGLVISSLNLFPILFGLAWLPLVCLFTRRYLLRAEPRDFALAATFLGVQLLGSDPTTVLQTGMLLLMFAISRGIIEKRARSVARRAGAVVAISIVAVLIAAVQVLPAADLVRDSVRSRGIPFQVSAGWSMPPARTAELAFPDVFGDPILESGVVYWAAPLYPRHRSPFFFTIYAGLLVFVLTTSGILVRAPGWRLVLTILGASIILAIGSHTPLFALLHRLKLTAWLRFPEKFVLMGIFAAIVFAAKMLDRLLHDDSRLARTALRVTLLVTVPATAIAVATYTPLYEPLFRSIWSIPPSMAVESMIEASRKGWLAAAVRGAALFFLLLQLTRMRRPLWLAAMGTFVLADLVSVAGRAPRIPYDAFRDAPEVVARFASERDRFRIFHLADWDTASRTANAYLQPGRDRYWVVRNALLPMATAGYGLRTVMEVDYDLTSLLPTADFTSSAWELARRRPDGWIDTVASMSNVWYVGVYRPFESAAAAARSAKEIEPVRFIEGRHYPRYYFARRIVTIRDRDEFVRKLASGRYEGPVAFVREPSFVPAAGTVRSWSETANSARIEVETEGRAFLVMSVTPHKYWRITIEGNAAPALITNIGYQGIVVPPGKHVIEMRYRNPLIALGAVVSITAVSALFGFVVLRRRQKRQPL